MNGVSLSVLFLSVNTGVFIGTLAAAVVVFAALGAFVGYTIYKKNTEKKVGEAGERRRGGGWSDQGGGAGGKPACLERGASRSEGTGFKIKKRI